MENNINIGLKIGSLNTVVAWRDDEQNDVSIKNVRTCIRYQKNFTDNTINVTVGDEAAKYADAKYPLNLGVVEKEEGINETIDILKSLEIPENGTVVLSSPATEIKEGENRLVSAVEQTLKPKKLWVYPEGICGSVDALGSVKTAFGTSFLSINMGSSTLEVGCFISGEQKHLTSHPEVSGNKVDSVILSRIQNSVGNGIVSLKQVRDMKETASLNSKKTFKVSTLTREGFKDSELRDEIIEPIRDYAFRVAEIVKSEIIETMDRNLVASIIDMPVVITGGMANIPGLPELTINRLNKTINRDFLVAYPKKAAHQSAAIGALAICEVLWKKDLMQNSDTDV